MTDTPMNSEPVFSGPWQGWNASESTGPFTDLLGRIYWRVDGPDVLTGIDVRPEHANNLGIIHGGFTMSLLDTGMFFVCWQQAGILRVMTLQATTDFLEPGRPGEPLVSRGRIVRETGRLVWLNGFVEQEERRIASWHGIMRKIGPEKAPA
jgi:uncharacterized protein (TIGR00369 family)